MVQPAPRMTTAPTPKRPSMETSCVGGIWACAAARVILHATPLVSVWRGENRMASRAAMNQQVCPDEREKRRVSSFRGERRQFWLLEAIWGWLLKCVVAGANSIATTPGAVIYEGMRVGDGE